MKTRLLIFSTLLGLLISCHKDDGPSTPKPIPENKAPGAFALLMVEDKGTDIDLLPTLTWNTATDPDGDTVSYDIFFGPDPDSMEQVGTGLKTTTFTFAGKLDMVRVYHWKVVAMDGKGGETASTVFSFKTRPAKVTRIEVTAPFDERSRHTSLVFEDKIWVMGGSFVTGKKNDVWASSDGTVWEQTKINNENSTLEPRNDFASEVWLGKMWMIGGNGPNGRLDDIWFSEDGFQFFGALPPDEFSAISGHSSLTFNGRMWIFGGNNDNGKSNEIWNSSNGDNWSKTPPTSSAIFVERSEHASVVYNDKIWIIGGQGGSGQNIFRLNDVWQSEDGMDWKLVTEEAGFSKRYSHQVIVFDDKMWLIGGHNGGSATNEIWYSTDGSTWIDATPEDSFIPVLDHTAVVFKDKIWVLGGSNAPEDDNLVWTIE